MSSLTAAQAELDQAKDREREAQLAYSAARAEADALRRQLTTGNGDSVTPADLAAADAKVEYAALALQGATSPLSDLSAAVQRARAEELCDSVVTTVPILGASLLDALDGVAAALAAVPAAAARYDGFIADSAHQLEVVARIEQERPTGQTVAGPSQRGAVVESPYSGAPKAPEPERPQLEPFRRLHYRYMGKPTVDRIPVTPCRGAAQLAAVVLPAMKALGASSALVDHLKELAQSAPTIPTS